MNRKCSLSFKCALGAFLLLAVGLGVAQDELKGMRVKIPFDFTVGNQSFSAGEYTIRPLLQHIMQLRSGRGEYLTGIQGNSVEAPKAPSAPTLVFNRYNQHYFLSQIWEAGATTGQQLIESSAEVELAQAADSPGEQIALSIAPPH